MSQLSDKLKKRYGLENHLEPKGCPPSQDYSDSKEEDLVDYIRFLNTSKFDNVRDTVTGPYNGDNTR